MGNELIGLIGILLILVLMLLRVSVGLTLMLVGFFGLVILNTWDSALAQLSSSAYTTANNYGLSVLPLFILMGMFISNTGLGYDLFRAVDRWIGHLRGGLAIATIGASSIFSSISGSANATTATLARICIPEMERYKYKTPFASSAVAAGGTLGALIPPSVLLIIYGALTSEPIGQLLIAGIIPGVTLALLFMLLISFQVRLNPELAPQRVEKVPLNEKIASLKSVWPFLLIFIVSIGGIYQGFFTPTEAGGVGAFSALVVALIMRRITFKQIVASLQETMSITVMIFLVLIGASLFSRFLALSRIPVYITNKIESLSVSPFVILLLIILVYIVLGMFLEGIAILVLTMPIIYPIIIDLGFDGIWFGIIMIILINIGVLTPPLGLTVFIISGVVPQVPIYNLFRAVIPVIFVMLMFIGLLIIFPEIATFLPEIIR